MKNARLSNLIAILSASVLLLVVTVYSQSGVVTVARANVINLLFLLIMSFGVFAVTYKCIGEANTMMQDFKSAIEELRSGQDWRQLSFHSTNLARAYDNFTLAKTSTQDDPVGADITDYINARLINHAIQKNICESISASMTGAGMLGTFLGLILGLRGFSTDYSEMQNSIGVLLSGIKTAFLTSIYGVTFSLLFNYIYRKSYQELIALLYSFHDSFYLYAIGNAQEDVNRRMLQTQMQQEKSLEHLVSGIEENLSQMSAAITERLEAHLKIVDAGVQAFLDKSTAAQQEQVRELVREYLTQINDSVLKGQLPELRKTIEAINQTSLASSDKLSDITNSLAEKNDSFIQANERFRETTDKMAEFVDGLEHSRAAMTERLQQFSEQLTSHQNATERSSIDFYERVNGYQDSIAVANEALRDSAKEINQSLVAVTSSNQELLKTVERLSNACQSVEHNLDASDALYQAFLTSGRELTDRVNENSEKITLLIEKAQASSQSVAEGLREEMLTDIQTSTEELRRVNGMFSSSVTTLSDNYEALLRALNDGLGRTFQSFDGETATIAEHFTNMLEELRDTVDYIPRRLNDALDIYFESKGGMELKDMETVSIASVDEDEDSFEQSKISGSPIVTTQPDESPDDDSDGEQENKQKQIVRLCRILTQQERLARGVSEEQ